MNKAEVMELFSENAALPELETPINSAEGDMELFAQEELAAVSPAEKKKHKKTYVPTAYQITSNRIFWVFIIGSFVGVVVEMLWCLVTRHYIESRQGLIYGWFNLVYGFGAVAMTLGLKWLAKWRDLWIFFGGAAIGSLFEYFCSWIQEMLFGTVSWQYYDLPFNIDGRINLLYSMFWGLLALIWIKNIYPFLCCIVDKFPKKLNTVLVCLLTVFMILNTAVSGAAVARMSHRRAGQPATSVVEVFLDIHYPDDRMQNIYPNMIFPDNK